MFTITDLGSAQPHALSDSGSDSMREGRATMTLAQRSRARIHPATGAWGNHWSGLAAEAAAHAADASINRIDCAGISMRAAGLIASAHGRVLSPIVRLVAHVLHSLRSLGWSVSAQGVVTPRMGLELAPIAAAASTLTAVLQAALHSARIAEHSAVTGLRAISDGLPEVVAPALPTSPAEATAVEVTAAPGAATEVTAVVPAQLTPPRAVSRPTAHGSITTVGDIAHAERIITLVSGVGSSSPDAVTKNTVWAQRLVAHQAAAGQKLAVIAWHDYPAPSTVVVAASPRRAHAAAERLVEFQRDLRRRYPAAQHDLVGYSYGSVVVGAARARDDRVASAIHVWGSPGIGRAKAARSPQTRPQQRPTPVISTHVPGDLIRLTTTEIGGAHGPDPSYPHARSWASYQWSRFLDASLWARRDFDTHSSYLWDPTTLRKLTRSGKQSAASGKFLTRTAPGTLAS